MHVRIKVFVARVQWCLYRISIFSLGVIAGLAGYYSFVTYQSLSTPVVFENQPLVLVAHAKEAEPVIEWKKGEFSAYTADESETDSQPDIMASGKKVYAGAIACPAFLSFGTKVEVKGQGTFTCEDRMAKRYRDSNHFDILFPSKAEAYAFGRQQLEWRVV